MLYRAQVHTSIYYNLLFSFPYVHCMYTAPISTEAPGTHISTLPPTLQTEQNHSSFDLDLSSEATAAALPQSPPPATTRGALHTPTRPTSLLVSPPPVSVHVSPAVGAIPNAQLQQGEGDDRFQSSEEEKTPDGGRREFVGPPYRYTPINNGETVVTPERQTFHPNTVFGYHFPLNAYRRQLSDNNAEYNSYSQRCERQQSEAQTQQVLRRLHSEPPYHVNEAPKDNNGQIIREEHAPFSHTATL